MYKVKNYNNDSSVLWRKGRSEQLCAFGVHARDRGVLLQPSDADYIEHEQKQSRIRSLG